MFDYIGKNKIKCTIIIVLAIIFIAWLIWSNLSIETNYYTISGEHLPASFDGFKIAHVSDLHNAEFGTDNSQLLNILRDAKPDIIAITGDSIDKFHTNTEITVNFLKDAMAIAPCYLVTGNHEGWLGIVEFIELEKRLEDIGVIVLHNEEHEIELGGEIITVFGVDDPDYRSGFSQSLKKGSASENYTVLLSHRPEHFEEYVENGYDLVLSGHAHGGQFRLPIIGGLLAPNQGWFPKYDSGLYTKNNTNMIVSRGIGNSVVPIRFNNRPQIVIIELKAR